MDSGSVTGGKSNHSSKETLKDAPWKGRGGGNSSMSGEWGEVTSNPLDPNIL